MRQKKPKFLTNSNLLLQFFISILISKKQFKPNKCHPPFLFSCDKLTHPNKIMDKNRKI